MKERAGEGSSFSKVVREVLPQEFLCATRRWQPRKKLGKDVPQRGKGVWRLAKF